MLAAVMAAAEVIGLGTDSLDRVRVAIAARGICNDRRELALELGPAPETPPAPPRTAEDDKRRNGATPLLLLLFIFMFSMSFSSW